MKEVAVTSIEEYLNFVNELARTGRIFRGVSSSEYLLLPKIGRSEYLQTYSLKAERHLLRLFKQRAMAFIQHKPESTLEWLALGQHHGLATRLLDWTVNPLTALFFAVQENEKIDGIVYTTHFRRSRAEFDPFNQKEPKKYYPSHLTPRIPAQEGLFTVQNKPQEPMVSDKITKIVIPSDQKIPLMKKLDHLGFNNERLFPGLDGAAKQMSWRMANKIGKW